MRAFCQLIFSFATVAPRAAERISAIRHPPAPGAPNVWIVSTSAETLSLAETSGADSKKLSRKLLFSA